MTLIELFDGEHMDNIVACLRLQPEEVFFLGDEEQMRPLLQRYRVLLDRKGIQTKISPKDVELNDIQSVTRTLMGILESREDCVIDITGGDERLVMAAGAAMALLPPEKQEKVAVRRFRMPGGEEEDLDGDDKALPSHTIALTAGELIALHGGTIYPTTMQPPASCTPADVDFLWEMLKVDPRGWNKLISIFRELEKPFNKERTEFYIRRDAQDFQKKWATLEPLFKKLRNRKVIEDIGRDGECRYRYKDKLVQHCLLKEGNLLEVKTLLEARAMREKGLPYFDDCMMSVNIDWDGQVSKDPKMFSGTHNEIDVILTKGMKALFVSCKNGDVGDGEMYKLCSVAEEFGSSYARKMLMVAELENEESLETRADDMGVYLVKHGAKTHRDGWGYIFKEAMKKRKTGLR